MHQSPPLFSKVRGVRPVYYTHPLIKSKHVLLFFSLQYQMSFQIMSMHAEASLFSTFLCIIKSFQIPSESTIYRSCIIIFLWSYKSVQILSECTTYPLVFIVFPAVPNRFKYRRPECTRHLPSLFSFLFSAVPNRFKCRLECTIYHPCFFKEATLFLTFPLV